MNNFQLCYNYLERKFIENGFQHIPPELDTIVRPANNTNAAAAVNNIRNNHGNNNMRISTSSNDNSCYLYLVTDDDVQARHELYYQLYQLVFAKQKQKRMHRGKNSVTYEWPPIIKQLIRCRYPGDIKDYVCYKNAIQLSLQDFIDVFQP
jgi:hypothetical protein